MMGGRENWDRWPIEYKDRLNALNISAPDIEPEGSPFSRYDFATGIFTNDEGTQFKDGVTLGSGAKRRLEKAIKALQKAEQKVTELETALEEAKQTLTLAQNEKKEAQKALDEEKTLLVAAQAVLEQAQTRLTEAQTTLKAAQEEKQSAQQAVDAAQVKVKELGG